MNPVRVPETSATGCRRVGVAAVGVLVAAATLVVSAVAAPSPRARACPSAAAVNKVLGTHLRTPVATKYLTYAKTCTYPGGLGSTRITFQTDTAKTFAASEKAAAAGIGGKLIKKVTVAGHPGWTTNLGSLYVFDVNQTIKILAPGIATARLEALVKTLL